RAERARGAGDVAVGARRPPREDRAAAARREAGLRRPGEPECRTRLPDALQPGARGAIRRARDAAACARAADAATADRMLRYLDDPGQRDGRLDGRLRRRADAARGLSKVSHEGLALATATSVPAGI